MKKWLLIGFLALSACTTNLKTAREVSHLESSDIEIEDRKIGGEIPHEINDNVLKWVNYFQGRGRHHMERYLSRSTRYMPVMKGILREEGLPEDLIYVALIESGFSSSAHSHANAVGYWQFIRGTGKAYGLRINPVLDERRDFELATRAAARYLKSLHMLFDDWYLAIAAYNVGENRVKRLVMKYHTRDFWELARRRKLPKETINYVPKYLAARMIGKNPEKYGFENLDYHNALSFERVSVNYPVNLKVFASKAGVDYSELKALNPSFRTDYAPTQKNGTLELRVPVGKGPQATELLAQSKVEDTRKLDKMMSARFITYRVRSGDTLGGIARKHRTRISDLRRLNRLGNRSFIRVGQRLQVPSYPGAYRATNIASDESTSVRSVASTSNSGSLVHKVRRGETLSHIARKYRISLGKLLSTNNLSMRSKIVVGQRLVIPGKAMEESSSRKIARKTVHIVRRGDTLTGLAARYSVPVRTIAKHNGLSDRDSIQIGNRLLIPGL